MLQAEDTASLSEVTREFAVRRPRPKLIMHIGGKYTTSRHDSISIVDAVFDELGRRAPPSSTQTRPLPGAPQGNFENWQAQAIASSRNRSEEHTSELQSLMRISYAVFCLKKKKNNNQKNTHHDSGN